ncbi:MAG: two pore domain potassium channel family protein [Hyphomicrobiales bacterium]|nr:ion transporter [Hyphomicrobiales bacterium]MDE1974642.1 two pore domain potassium channel family protein [Hyphomicrobiales bacterium]MDE2284996.1 two pore domain potassium channel family protein [Hyphomicrobiales bacterium]MDE2373763.1 two pore domain potassium channel family protein [Hyphomicrobiales bacterium]
MTEKAFRILQARLSDPLLTALAIMLAIFLFVVAPLQGAGFSEAHDFALAFAFVLAAAVFVVSGSMLAAAAIVAAIVLVFIATLLRLRHASHFDIALEATAWIIAGVTLAVVVARAVFARGPVTYHRIIGAILLYMSIGLIFTSLFCFVALFEPNAFTGLERLQDNLAVAGNLTYFSFVTLTSVGYGDIVPLHPFARGLANVEAVIGQLFPATLLARLVTLEIASRRGH